MRVLTPRIRISIRILPLRISGPAVIHLRTGAAAYIEPISGSQQAGSVFEKRARFDCGPGYLGLKIVFERAGPLGGVVGKNIGGGSQGVRRRTRRG